MAERGDSRREQTEIAHCGWKTCKQKKLVLVQRDEVTGVERGVCEKHRTVAVARVGWMTVQEFDKW